MDIDNKTDKHVTLNLGKIDYYGNGRKINLATVTVGFTMISGNKESCFSVTGDVWNRIHTDIVRGGCGTPEFLLKEFFPDNDTLKRIVELADKWHLTNFSNIPDVAKEEIFDLMAEIESK